MHAVPVRGTRSRALAFLAGAALAVAAFAVAAAGCGPTTPSAAGCKAKLLPGDLVITEVFADAKAVPGGMGGDAGREWLEIYNAKGEAIDLEGLTITSSRPDGSASNTHGMAAAMIAPGQFFTLGNAERGAAPPYIDYGYGGDLGDLFNSGGGKLTLSCDDAEIDSAVYDDVREGHARELSAAQPPDYTRNDSLDAWCQATDSEFETGNFGTPGAANDCAPLAAGRCDDGGTMRAVVSPGPGDLVITEVMPSPMRAADATGEWFEAKVMADVDLNGVGLDRTGDRDVQPDVIAGAPCVRVSAGDYVVFARSTDAGMNGGLPAAAIAGLFRFAIVPGTTTPGDVAMLAGNTVIDAVRWTRSTGGTSLQLDPGRIDATANDDESNFCNATLPYGPASSAADLGTPGAANTPCATLPGPGMCDDGIGVRAIVRPIPGQLVISEVLANPANVPMGSTDAQREWFEVANLGGVAFDLNELTLGRIGTAGAPVQSARCLSVGSRGFAVLARSADPAANSMLPEVAATFRFGLVDT
ncbi:MAG TPA: lamin tail domain-containing protein, partial [Kofleriaceae bacterium]|nr:lamin tail domain-containing protein [Kofleriaceae bacterium]